MNRILCIILLFLSGCTPSPPENSEVKAWFDLNYESLEKLASLGLEYKSLRRAEIIFKDEKNYYGQPSEAALKAEKEVFEIVATLKVDFVAYWRYGMDDFNRLRSMTIPYYRWGLGLGGYSKGIVYFPDYTKESMPSTEYSTYIYLNKEGWFIDASDTR